MMTHDLSNKPRSDILVVDDVPDNIRLLSKMLIEQGYSVRKALNGQMALTAAQIAPPNLILLDINMPEINGYEVCKKLKESVQTRYIPVIFLSAMDDVIDKVKAFQIGGVDFITKPFYFEEVLVRIQTQLTIQNLQSQLQEQNAQLQQALGRFQKTQTQLMQREETVGRQLVVEANHENNNSICSISGHLTPREHIQKLLDIITIYQKEYPNPTPVVKQALEEANLDLIISDIHKLTW